MKLYSDNAAISSCKGWYLLLDNDFLGELYKDEEIVEEFLDKFRESYFIVDPITEFEFLRDVFEPQQRSIKEAFISKPMFVPVASRQEIFLRVQENALILSKIYSHKGHNKNTKISLVDLFLAGRCMLNAPTIMIVTGNKKDFPNSIFDITAVINIEQGDGSIKPYSIVQFNKQKFDDCYKALLKMEEKHKQGLG